ncbi:snRNA-activating protein complex subunit 4 [Anaeramoeba flamelloides]|uniref:snRNA-activating protein complex subunit 4 n=1 Tax=Anaeramoeba flamelloides TaxID=1746091 RepID=A0ABQ8YIA9_9EUKA|nr:snRNA-activating protein complex subunit 4 [Anaeramoeba flamelloides]
MNKNPNKKDFKKIFGPKPRGKSPKFDDYLKREIKKIKKWSFEDEQKLLKLVKQEKLCNWYQISTHFDQFSSTDCLKRYRQLKRVVSIKGAWTSVEDEVLRSNVKYLGEKSWAHVSYFFPGRSSKQCRERWKNQLRPGINHKPFTIEEENLLFEKQKEFGNKWSQIAQFFIGRPDNMLKNIFHSVCARKGITCNESAERRIKSGMDSCKEKTKRKRIVIGRKKDYIRSTKNKCLVSSSLRIKKEDLEQTQINERKRTHESDNKFKNTKKNDQNQNVVATPYKYKVKKHSSKNRNQKHKQKHKHKHKHKNKHRHEHKHKHKHIQTHKHKHKLKQRHMKNHRHKDKQKYSEINTNEKMKMTQPLKIATESLRNMQLEFEKCNLSQQKKHSNKTQLENRGLELQNGPKQDLLEQQLDSKPNFLFQNPKCEDEIKNNSRWKHFSCLSTEQELNVNKEELTKSSSKSSLLNSNKASTETKNEFLCSSSKKIEHSFGNNFDMDMGIDMDIDMDMEMGMGMNIEPSILPQDNYFSNFSSESSKQIKNNTIWDDDDWEKENIDLNSSFTNEESLDFSFYNLDNVGNGIGQEKYPFDFVEFND